MLENCRLLGKNGEKNKPAGTHIAATRRSLLCTDTIKLLDCIYVQGCLIDQISFFDKNCSRMFYNDFSVCT